MPGDDFDLLSPGRGGEMVTATGQIGIPRFRRFAVSRMRSADPGEEATLS